MSFANNLTDAEIQALKYYIGDISGNDPFWSDPKAYVLLNSLFFEGIATESARAKEGKRLNTAILEDSERLMQFFGDLFSVFAKCRLTADCRTFRVERYNDYLACKSAGRTVSLTSTSTAGFLSAYRDRIGIALMEFTLPVGTPCINVSTALAFYAKPEEAEVLLPPFLPMSFSESAPEGDMLAITDAEDKPPVVFCQCCPLPFSGSPSQTLTLPERGSAAGIRVCNALMSGNSPDPADVAEYSQWKIVLRENLRELFNAAVNM